MTIEELLAREEIRHVMARYNMSGDSLRKEDFASCFTEDAELVTTGLSFSGRESILNGLFSRVADSQPPSRRPRFVRHNLTTSLITFDDGDHARGRTYFQVNTDIGLDHCGVYQDEFRREGEGWKIARRVVKTEYWAPESFFRA